MNWKQAFTLGLLAPGVWEGERVPVAYSYNGVVLPGLPPEILKYKYLKIVGLTVGSPTLIVTGTDTEPSTIRKTPVIGDAYDVNGSESGTYQSAACYTTTEPDVWYVSEAAEGENMVSLGRFVWANYDVYTSDGELFLAASDPIPVYE